MRNDRRGLHVFLFLIALGGLLILLYYLSRLFDGIGSILPI